MRRFSSPVLFALALSAAFLTVPPAAAGICQNCYECISHLVGPSWFEALVESGEPLPRWQLPAGRHRVICGAAGFGVSFQPPLSAPATAPVHVECTLSRLAVRRGRVHAVAFNAETAELPAVRLRAGGGLESTLEVPQDFPLDQYLVGLRQAGALPDSATSERPWLRRLQQAGETRLAWPALAPGTYRLWLKPRAGSDPTLLPIELATASVSAGAVSRIEVSVPRLASHDAPSASRRGSELRALVQAQGELDGRSVEALRWHLGSARAVPAAGKPASGGHLVRLDAQCRPGDRYSLRFSNGVTPLLEVEECPAKVPFALTAYPASTIHGRALAPIGVARPRRAEVVARTCGAGGEPGVSLGAFPAELEAQGSWSARVLTGCLDLSARFEGFVEVAWRRVTLVAAEQRDLGEQRLIPGGSVLVRVVDAEDGRGVGGATVVLASGEALERDVEHFLSRRLRELAGPALKADAQGWVHFSSISPGTVVALAEAADGRRASSERFAVAGAEELVLPDLELAEPATLYVGVSGLTKEALVGQTLEVSAALAAAGCSYQGVGEMRPVAAIDEPILFDDLMPGAWRFEAWLSGKDGGRRLVGAVDAELLAGTSTGVNLAVSLLRYRGVVLRRDQPLAAELRLLPLAKAGTGRVTVTTNQEGEFDVSLTAQGAYRAYVRSLEGKLNATVAKVHFGDPEERVEVQLPSGVLRGRVVDGAGDPVAGAGVAARQLAVARDAGGDEESWRSEWLSASAEADALGNFELCCLGEGAWEVVALSPRGRSRAGEVELAKDEVVEGLRLVVEEGRELKGQLLASGLPLADVTIHGRMISASGVFLGPLRPATTDPQGRFLASIPAPEVALVDLQVAPPGGPLSLFRTPVGESEVRLEVPTRGGRLEISLAAEQSSFPDPTFTGLMSADGAFVSLAELGRFSRSEPQAGGPARFILPDLAPGHWRLVRARSMAELAALYGGSFAGLEVLAAGELLPGEALRFELP